MEGNHVAWPLFLHLGKFPSCVCLMKMQVQDTYDMVVHLVVLKQKELSKTGYCAKWNEAYYRVNSKLLKKMCRLLRLSDLKLEQSWYN